MARRLTREIIERDFPELRPFFGYLHEDWPIDHATPQDAIEVAIGDYPAGRRREVLDELATVLARLEDDVDARRVLNLCLGGNVYFRKARGARAFLDHVEQRLQASLKDSGKP